MSEQSVADQIYAKLLTAKDEDAKKDLLFSITKTRL